MTALQWMTSFRVVNVHHVGKANGFCWALVTADVDGTELQDYFVMEHDDGSLRVIQNLDHASCVEAMRDPAPFWNHPRATLSQPDRDSQPRLM